MQKNVAGQKWVVFAFNRGNQAPVAGDAANITAKVRKDHGSAAALADTSPTEIEDGYYEFDLAQAETNADHLHLLPESSTSGVQVIGVPGTLQTVPTRFTALSVNASGQVPVSNANSVADAVLARDVSSANPSAEEHSLRFLVLMHTEADLTSNSGYLTVFDTTGAQIAAKAVTTSPSADRITGVS